MLTIKHRLLNNCVFILNLILILVLGCHAPHNNPLDPENSNNKLAALNGLVKTMNIPSAPIDNSTIIFESQNLITTTNSEGYFSFENIRQMDGWLKIIKEGFKTDSIYILWGNNRNLSVNIHLNSLPILQTSSFYSVIVNRYTIEPLAYLVINESVTDRDNDIDSIFVTCPSLNFIQPLEYNVSKKYYEALLYPASMNVSDIEIIVGREFNIIVKDKFNDLIEVKREQVSRIIKSEILFESPKDQEIVPPKPTLRWKRFTPGFVFTYTTEIYTNEIDPQLVWQKENISPDDISIPVSDSLSAGNYFWVIWGIDNFQNRTRSKPASFVVE